MRRRGLATTAAALAVAVALAAPPSAAPAAAAANVGAGIPAEVAAFDPDAKPVGAASVRWLFWRVFDARLWSSTGAFSWDGSSALSLTYRRGFSTEELIGSTLDEIERLRGWPEARLAAFAGELAGCFPAVGDGDRITAIGRSPNAVAIYHNGRRTCALTGPDMRRDFLSIWLSPDSRFPDASAELTGRQR